MIVNYLILLITTVNLGFSVYFYYKKPFIKNITIRYLPKDIDVSIPPNVNNVYSAIEDTKPQKGDFISPNKMELILENKGSKLSIDDLLEE